MGRAWYRAKGHAMRIINTIDKKGKAAAAVALCCLISVCGCAQKDGLSGARRSAGQSDRYYAQAVEYYKHSISGTLGADNARLELGKLYYGHGAFSQALDVLSACGLPEAKKYLALSYYQLGKFTDAREAFSKTQAPDDQSLYYFGLTCEKLNLFDQALDNYKKITSPLFFPLARARVNDIQRQARPQFIRDVDKRVADIIAAAPADDAYPQAGALILLADEKISITPAHAEVSEMRYIIKILNERGKESFSESHIDYDSTYETIALEYARTIKPDGAVVDVGSRHIRDVSKYLNFPLYSNARVFIISFPEIAEGSVIEYKVRVSRNELINKKDVVEVYPVQSSEPILQADFVLETPQDYKPGIKLINESYNTFGAALAPSVQQGKDSNFYRWHFTAIPQIIPEANMPPAVEINPSILISTFSSWDDIYAWWIKLAQDKIQADQDIKDKVKALTAHAGSEEARLRSLYNYCAKEIRYVAVEYGQAGYEPHRAGEVFRNKYGDCKDKAILLVTMLREAGFSAWPVLIPTKNCYDLRRDFPSMLFDHCIAAVWVNGKTVFLDATAETCGLGDLPGGDQGRNVMIFKESGFVLDTVPVFDAGHNQNRQSVHLVINQDESIQGDKEIATAGFYDQVERYWLLYTPPKLVEEALRQKIQGFSIGATLQGYTAENVDDLDKPVTLRYRFRGPEYFMPAGPLRILPQMAGLDTSVVAQDTRVYPVDFGQPDRRQTSVELTVPAGLKVHYLPGDTRDDTPWFSCEVTYAAKANVINFNQVLTLKDSYITREEYPAFKKAFEALAKEIKQSIVLEKVE